MLQKYHSAFTPVGKHNKKAGAEKETIGNKTHTAAQLKKPGCDGVWDKIHPLIGLHKNENSIYLDRNHLLLFLVPSILRIPFLF